MGRGRQRAKQRKVARNLKYFSPETDYDALARELSAGGQDYAHDNDSLEDEYDPYAEYAAKYDIDDEDDEDYSEGDWVR